MDSFFRKTQGAISIFLVLILVPMLTVTSVLIDASRVELARGLLASAGDSALNSALTQYDSKLKEMYGLMATSQNIDTLLSELDSYYQESIVSAGLSKEDAQIFSAGLIGSLGSLSSSENVSDFLNLSFVPGEFSAVKTPNTSLIEPQLMRAQIVNFMKYRAPINTGLGLLGSLQSFVNLSKETDLVDKRTEYYKKEQSVLENLKESWKHINNYKPNEFAELLNVSVKTLQRWDREGILVAKRTPTDRRYYTYDQYLEYKGIKQQVDRKIVIYTRVSTNNQKDDLRNQITFLQQFTNAKGIIVDEIIEDVGSGLNYNRKKME